MGAPKSAPLTMQTYEPAPAPPPPAPPPPLPEPVAPAEMPKFNATQQRNPQLDSVVNARKQAAAMAAGLGMNGTVLTSPQGAGSKSSALLQTAGTKLLGG